MKTIFFLLLSFCFFSCSDPAAKGHAVPSQLSASFSPASSNSYPWMKDYNVRNALVNRIGVPEGYERVPAEPGSFADWLRYQPLIEGEPSVHLYNGSLKRNQNVHYAIINIDVGNKDLQQCADAVMRMRAEYLYSRKEYEALHFNFTSGHTVGFKKWSEGYRTVIKGNKVSWVKSAAADDSYKTFRSWCNTIFNYAGTASLSKELKAVTDIKDIQPGDVFIVGGFPGHAVLVSDVCTDKKTGKKLFLLQQSYMPAQEIHILRNYNDLGLNPWYSTDFSGSLNTPEWTFSKEQLKRF